MHAPRFVRRVAARIRLWKNNRAISKRETRGVVSKRQEAIFRAYHDSLVLEGDPELVQKERAVRIALKGRPTDPELLRLGKEYFDEEIKWQKTHEERCRKYIQLCDEWDALRKKFPKRFEELDSSIRARFLMLVDHFKHKQTLSEAASKAFGRTYSRALEGMEGPRMVRSGHAYLSKYFKRLDQRRGFTTWLGRDDIPID